MLFRKDLKPFQREIVDHCKSGADSLLLVDVGLGKTAAVGTVISDVLCSDAQKGRKRRWLVVAPKTVAQNVWAQEFKKWDHLHWLKVNQAALPSKQARFQAIETPSHVVVINYANFVWLMEHYKKRMPFDYVVFDEVDYLKAPGSKRFKSIRYRVNEFKMRIGMTGSFSSEHLLDVWGPAYLVSGGQAMGTSFDAFKRKWFTKEEYSWRYHPVPGAQEYVTNRIAPFTYRAEAKDHLDKAEVTVVDRWFDLPPRVLKQYRQLEKELMIELEHGGDLVDDDGLSSGAWEQPDVLAVSKSVVLQQKLRQLTSFGIYHQEQSPDGTPLGPRKTIHLHDTKIQMLKDLRSELGKSLLCAYFFRASLDKLGDVPYVGSGVPDTLRTKHFEDWNAKRIDFLAIHPQSASHGLNLQHGGHHLVFLDLPWSLNRYMQTVGRLDRRGQEHPVIVHRLLARDTIDADVASALANKQNAQTAVLQGIKERTRRRVGA